MRYYQHSEFEIIIIIFTTTQITRRRSINNSGLAIHIPSLLGGLRAQITKHYAGESVWKNWVWHTEGDLFMNGAIFEKSGGANQRKVNKDEWVKPKPGTYVTRLARNSGALDCRPGKPC